MLRVAASSKVVSGRMRTAGGGGDGVQGLGGEEHGVARLVVRLASQEGEDLRGAGDVEQVDALEEDDDDESFDGAHAVSARSVTENVAVCDVAVRDVRCP